MGYDHCRMRIIGSGDELWAYFEIEKSKIIIPLLWMCGIPHSHQIVNGKKKSRRRSPFIQAIFQNDSTI